MEIFQVSSTEENGISDKLYKMTDRSFHSDTSFYRYTGKERDVTTGYDYFGARYYNSRIGRWGQVEPLLDKYPSWSPYVYSLVNPINIFDPNGKDPRRDQLASKSDLMNHIKSYKSRTIIELLWSYEGIIPKRYFVSEESGFIDMVHFMAAAIVSNFLKPLDFFDIGVNLMQTIILGDLMELYQGVKDDPSAFDSEDPFSNVEGARFGNRLGIFSTNVDDTFIRKFEVFIDDIKIIDPNDERISEKNLYIPKNEKDTPLPPRSLYSGTYFRPYFGHSPDMKEELNKIPD